MEEARACLIANEASLSAKCREVIETLPQDDTTQESGADEEQNDDHSIDNTAEPKEWQYWLVRLWWVYPTGLVLLIQTLACFKIRQIRKMEALSN